MREYDFPRALDILPRDGRTSTMPECGFRCVVLEGARTGKEVNIMRDREMGTPRNENVSSPARPRRMVSHAPGVLPGKTGKKRLVLAAILLDALRGARTYVTDFSAGRGAE